MTISRIKSLRLGLLAMVVCFEMFTGSTKAQSFGEQCLPEFTQGKANFVLDADESVKEGATFISAPPVTVVKDCVVSCCKDRHCNLALMENGVEEGSVKSCYLFNCLYKQKKVCRFVRKDGFNNYVLTSVFGNYLDEHEQPDEDDKPPIANPGQDRVIQPQETVTLNGLQSTDDNDIASFQWTMLSGHPSTVIEKTSFEDEVRVSNLTSGVYKFQLTVIDSIGQSDSAQITILVLTPEQSNHHCLVPMKVGPCRGSFPRWHYNGISEKCEEFSFGGCRENFNNYLTKADCQVACDGVSVMPPGGGPVGSGRRVTVPVPEAERCQETCKADEFTCSNGCCLNPGLECDGKAQCTDGSDELSCTELRTGLKRLLEIPVDEKKARCVEPPVTGPCRASMTRWFYDPYDKACSRFNYGGCKGNENNFESDDQCLLACKGVTSTDVFAPRGKFGAQEGDDDKGSLIIAIVLGVAILVVLAVLAYCCLRGKKKQPPQHQRVGMNGKQVVTLEDTEKLVYNSTTKPI